MLYNERKKLSFRRIASLFSKSKFLEQAHLSAAAIPHSRANINVLPVSPTSLKSLHIPDPHTLHFLSSHTALTKWFSEEARKVLCGNKKEPRPSMGWKEKAGLTQNTKILITINSKSQFHVNQKTNVGYLKCTVAHESFR